MKKTVFPLLLLFLLFCICITACGGQDGGDFTPPPECEHSFGDWYTESELTCTQDGVKSRICDKCSDRELDVTPAITHNFVNDYCQNCGISILEPGLYDENGEMIASWDTLVNTYGMDIEKDYFSDDYNICETSPYYVLTHNDELKKGVRIVIGNQVERIGCYAFYYTPTITEVNVGERVKHIGYSSFEHCENLRSVSISYSVRSIADFAFAFCKKLPSIVIPDSVEKIDDVAFYFCDNLTSVKIGKGLTYMGYSIFGYCPKLSSVEIAGNPPLFDEYLFYSCTSLKSMVIPDSVTAIEASVFACCTALESVVIPDSVTEIGEEAFNGCESLTHVYYTGTEEEWAAISVGGLNAPLKNATIIYNYVPNE